VTIDKLPKPIIFHDGRLVQKPTPLMALLIILWIPIGFILACLRIAAGALLPMPLVYYAFRALGVRVTVKGTPPPPAEKSTGQSGVLFVCSHRTLLDPIFLSTASAAPSLQSPTQSPGSLRSSHPSRQSDSAATAPQTRP
jgi:1-acyl-sn-glycerol-3-phosphate acyltransferase